MTRRASERPHEAAWLVAIIVAGVAMRVAAIVGFVHAPESDELAYRAMAVNLAGGHGILDGMGNRAMYNAGYPLFILAPVFLVFGDNLLAARAANLVLGAVSIVLCHATAREAGADRRGRLLAAACWAFYLPASVYCVYLFKENAMTPLMLGMTWCTLRLVIKPALGVAAGGGVLLGLIALTGNAALSLAVAAAFAAWIAPAAAVTRCKMIALAVGVSLVTVAPWMYRNLEAVGAPVLNTNGGFNLYLGNNPAATGRYMSIGDTPLGPSWPDLRKLGEREASELLKTEAIHWIGQNPGRFARLAVTKAVLFWTPPYHDGKGNVTATELLVRRLWAVQFVILVVAALGGLCARTLRTRETAILWISVASYTAVHMVFYVIYRYREPIMPMVCILAAMSMATGSGCLAGFRATRAGRGRRPA